MPITFLDKYNPDQFEIIGLAPERLSEENASLQTKRYINAIQHKKDGSICGGNKVNDGPTLLQKDRVVMIGTALNHMESIIKYSQNNKEFKDAFVMLYVSLQNYVYIELFKIFDRNGKDSKENSIYTLMNVIETEDMKYHKKLDMYKSVIESIKNRRKSQKSLLCT